MSKLRCSYCGLPAVVPSAAPSERGPIGDGGAQTHTAANAKRSAAVNQRR